MKTLKRSITVLVCLILFVSCTTSVKKIDFNLNYNNGNINIYPIYSKNQDTLLYKGEAFTGELFGVYDWVNGLVKVKINYKEGRRNGLWEEYWENGHLKKKENYKDGKEDGLSEFYYENGKLEDKSNYKAGKMNGLREIYWENGQLHSKRNFKDGKEDGLSEFYYDNGHLEKKEKYKDGQLIFKYINPNPNPDRVTLNTLTEM